MVDVDMFKAIFVLVLFADKGDGCDADSPTDKPINTLQGENGVGVARFFFVLSTEGQSPYKEFSLLGQRTKEMYVHTITHEPLRS